MPKIILPLAVAPSPQIVPTPNVAAVDVKNTPAKSSST